MADPRFSPSWGLWGCCCPTACLRHHCPHSWAPHTGAGDTAWGPPPASSGLWLWVGERKLTRLPSYTCSLELLGEGWELVWPRLHGISKARSFQNLRSKPQRVAPMNIHFRLLKAHIYRRRRKLPREESRYFKLSDTGHKSVFEHVELGKNTLKYMKNMEQETKGRTILRKSRWNAEKEQYQPGGMGRRAPEWGRRGVGRGPLYTLGAPGTPTHCQGRLAWETLCSGELCQGHGSSFRGRWCQEA